jgi:hypothetical protein
MWLVSPCNVMKWRELTSRPGHSSVVDEQFDQVGGSRSRPCCQAVAHCTDDVNITGTQKVHWLGPRGRPGPRRSGLRVTREWNTCRQSLLEFTLQVALNKFLDSVWEPRVHKVPRLIQELVLLKCFLRFLGGSTERRHNYESFYDSSVLLCVVRTSTARWQTSSQKTVLKKNNDELTK